MLAASAAGEVELAVAGGTLTPIPTPGPSYSNSGTDPWPMLVYLPTGYSATGTPYPLVFCLHGNGEVGNGTSDGTLIPSATNQLCYMFTSGPMQLIANGSAYFGSKGVIVVQPQSDVGSGAAFNGTTGTINRVDLSMKYALANYNIDPNRIYAMGLSCGAGGLVRYAYASATNPAYTLCTVIPIANIQGISTTYTAFSAFTKSITWFINDSDDTTAYLIDSTGRINLGQTSNTYGYGWAGGISLYLDQAILGGAVPADSTKDRCLNTHPDEGAILAGGFNTNGFIPAGDLTGTYSGAYKTATAAGWSWVPNEVFSAGSTLQITVRQGGGHAGWNETFGQSTPNLPFWTWLLAQRLGQTPTAMVLAPSLVVTPGSATLCGGQTRQFTASALDDTQTPLAPQPAITWSCASGTISATGLYTANASHGTGTVTASATINSTLYQFSVPVSLVPPTIVMTPGSCSMDAAQMQQFTASATNSVGTPLQPQPSFTWSCRSGSISATGLYIAPGSGSDTVTAAAESMGTAYSCAASISLAAGSGATGSTTATGSGTGTVTGASATGTSSTATSGTGTTTGTTSAAGTGTGTSTGSSASSAATASGTTTSGDLGGSTGSGGGGGGCGLGGGTLGVVVMLALGLRRRERLRATRHEVPRSP